jgi:hypothetical protein
MEAGKWEDADPKAAPLFLQDIPASGKQEITANSGPKNGNS